MDDLSPSPVREQEEEQPLKVSRSSMRKNKNRMSLISEHEKQITEQVNQADEQKDKVF